MNTEKIMEDIQSVQDNIREIKSTWGNTIMTLDNIKSGLKADVQKKVDEAYQRGHDDGYKAGCSTAFKPVSDAEYQRGLEDAWVAVRKIVSMPDDPYWELFGDYKAEIIKNTTVSEVIAKLKAYEESKNKICVGDIVYFKGKPEIKACVTAINESGMETTFCGIAITNVETYCSVGNPYSFCRTDDWCKTGERFDIEQLWRGEDNA